MEGQRGSQEELCEDPPAGNCGKLVDSDRGWAGVRGHLGGSKDSGWWQHPDNTCDCLNTEHNIILYILHAVIKQKRFSSTCMRPLDSILVFNTVSNSPKHFIQYFIYYKVLAIII